MVDPANRERGLKAAIHNPRVSEQAKQRDREILENEYGAGADPDYIPTATAGGGTESSSHDISSTTSSSKMSKSKSAGSAPSSSSVSNEYSTTSAYSAGHQGKRTNAPPSSKGIMIEESEEMTSGSGMTGGKDTSNVIRGLKAAISNPNVSEKAKERDHQRLRELGGE